MKNNFVQFLFVFNFVNFVRIKIIINFAKLWNSVGKFTEVTGKMISKNPQIINMKRWSMLFGDDSQFVSDLLLFRIHRTTKIMAIIGIIIYVAAILCRISYGYPNYNKVKTFFHVFFCCCFTFFFLLFVVFLLLFS